jgi:hypothetical protein
MKTLEEKKLLVKMSRMLGQPVDPELLESIKREEELAKFLFKEPLIQSEPEPEPIPILKKDVIQAEQTKLKLASDELTETLAKLSVEELTEVICQMSSSANKAELLSLEKSTLRYFIKELVDQQASEPKEPEKPKTVIEKVVQTISNTTSNNTQTLSSVSLNEFELLKKTVQSLSQKIAFNGMGGGGTGVVRISDTDDFDKQSYGEGKFLQWSGGMFRLADVDISNTNVNFVTFDGGAPINNYAEGPGFDCGGVT